MRVGTSMMYHNAQQSITDRRSDVTRFQEQVSSGHALNRLSDDPQSARRSLRAQSLLSGIDSNRTSLGQGERLLALTEGALSSAGDLMQRVREMAVQFANDTYSTADRASAADELVQIRERMYELVNTKDNDRYLFGGLGSAAPPFDGTGAFVGDTGQVELPIGRGNRVEVTLEGGSPFIAGSASPTSATIFGAFDTLETALRADNGPAVGAVLDEISSYQEQMREAQQTIGHRYTRIEHARQALDQVEITAHETLERDRDVDYVDAITQLKLAETGLQGALTVTARLDSLNLMNFL